MKVTLVNRWSILLAIAFVSHISYAQNPQNDVASQNKSSRGSNTGMGDPGIVRTVDNIKVEIWILTSDQRNQMTGLNTGANSSTDNSTSGKGKNAGKSKKEDHFMVVKVINDSLGKAIGNDVKVKVTSPAKKAQVVDLQKANDAYESGLAMREKGTYQITTTITVNNQENRKTLQLAPFTYQVQP